MAEEGERADVIVIGAGVAGLSAAGDLADLADRNAEGVFLRTIIKTEDPERYGVRVGDYFV